MFIRTFIFVLALHFSIFSTPARAADYLTIQCGVLIAAIGMGAVVYKVTVKEPRPRVPQLEALRETYSEHSGPGVIIADSASEDPAIRTSAAFTNLLNFLQEPETEAIIRSIPLTPQLDQISIIESNSMQGYTAQSKEWWLRLSINESRESWQNTLLNLKVQMESTQ